LTPAAREVTARAGMQERFGQAANRSLRQRAGIARCESTVPRTTEAAGERLGQLLEQGRGVGKARPWEWHRDRTGQSWAYVRVDRTGLVRPGPPGAKGDGRLVAGGLVVKPPPREPDAEALAQPGDGVRYRAGR
jgi:hypothetical protein